jgi:transposase InsO family protein
VGAAGTFVVRKPGSRAKFRTALLRKLPFEAEIVLCDGRDLMRLETENPFGAWPVCCPCPHHPVAGALRVAVTAHPTAEWTGQQLREAFPFDQLPRYLLRDRDAIFGLDFREQVRDLGIQEVLSTPRSPWQRAYVERVIGSIRRECLDHVIVFHEASLRRTLNLYFDYYHRSRTHLSLGKDSPEPRPVQPPELGRVVAVSQVGGLHHRYERRAA